MNKILKRIFIFLFLIISITNFILINYTYAESEIASGSCGNNIKWSLNNEGTLTITGNGSMTGKSCAWADYKDQVKKVIINEGITVISDCAFEYNNNLETVTLPSTLTTINRRAFAECLSLKNIVFPNNLSKIGISAFYKCTSLEIVDLPESVIYINDAAFAECTSLKSVTIREFYNSIADSIYTFYETAKIYGYKYSNAFYYARRYGRTFVDLNTNETTKITVTNKDYLDALPTLNLKALGVTSHASRILSNNNVFKGYNTDFCNDIDILNENYKKIKSKVDELTAGCKTDREKAYAIFYWVFYNIDYKYAYGADAEIERIYNIFNTLQGNCEAYTMLTNYMLYLCNIPVGTASNLTHEWSVAYVDGKWIYIDSTHGIFDKVDMKNTVNQISFAYDGLVYVIDDPSEGGKVTGIAKKNEEIVKLSTFTIPTNSYMKSIYPTTFDDDIELKAEKGSIGETFIRKNRKFIFNDGNIIVGRNKNILKGDVNLDGKITLADYTKILAHVKKTQLLTGNALNAADVNNDGKVTLADYTKVLAHVKKTVILN